MLPLRHRALWQALSLLLVLTVVWGSLQTQVDLPAPGGFDKFEHLGSYCFLTVWFTGMHGRGRYWIIALMLAALGLSMEIMQYLMAAGREADPYDMLANAIGVGLGLGLAFGATGGWTPRIEAWLHRN